MEAAFETLKDPEFVAEAEKTRKTLNPIPGTTLHSMVVEGSSGSVDITLDIQQNDG